METDLVLQSLHRRLHAALGTVLAGLDDARSRPEQRQSMGFRLRRKPISGCAGACPTLRSS